MMDKDNSISTSEDQGPSLSREDEEELLQIFNLVDADRSGSISQEELAELLATLGMHVSEYVVLEN